MCIDISTSNTREEVSGHVLQLGHVLLMAAHLLFRGLGLGSCGNRGRRGGPISGSRRHFYPKGYSGKIRLISAISSDKKFIGMRVISHKETPGLGDGIDVRKSNWIHQFSNLPINQFDFNQWKLKEDGGQFDSMTGATITSEALVNASSELISLFENNEIK